MESNLIDMDDPIQPNLTSSHLNSGNTNLIDSDVMIEP